MEFTRSLWACIAHEAERNGCDAVYIQDETSGMIFFHVIDWHGNTSGERPMEELVGMENSEEGLAMLAEIMYRLCHEARLRAENTGKGA